MADQVAQKKPTFLADQMRALKSHPKWSGLAPEKQEKMLGKFYDKLVVPYHAKHKDVLDAPPSREDWLSRQGFKQKAKLDINAPVKIGGHEVGQDFGEVVARGVVKYGAETASSLAKFVSHGIQQHLEQTYGAGGSKTVEQIGDKVSGKFDALARSQEERVTDLPISHAQRKVAEFTGDAVGFASLYELSASAEIAETLVQAGKLEKAAEFLKGSEEILGSGDAATLKRVFASKEAALRYIGNLKVGINSGLAEYAHSGSLQKAGEASLLGTGLDGLLGAAFGTVADRIKASKMKPEVLQPETRLATKPPPNWTYGKRASSSDIPGVAESNTPESGFGEIDEQARLRGSVVGQKQLKTSKVTNTQSVTPEQESHVLSTLKKADVLPMDTNSNMWIEDVHENYSPEMVEMFKQKGADLGLDKRYRIHFDTIGPTGQRESRLVALDNPMDLTPELIMSKLKQAANAGDKNAAAQWSFRKLQEVSQSPQALAMMRKAMSVTSRKLYGKSMAGLPWIQRQKVINEIIKTLPEHADVMKPAVKEMLTQAFSEQLQVSRVTPTASKIQKMVEEHISKVNSGAKPAEVLAETKLKLREAGKSPRALGKNPRAQGQSPRQLKAKAAAKKAED